MLISEYAWGVMSELNVSHVSRANPGWTMYTMTPGEQLFALLFNPFRHGIDEHSIDMLCRHVGLVDAGAIPPQLKPVAELSRNDSPECPESVLKLLTTPIGKSVEIDFIHLVSPAAQVAPMTFGASDTVHAVITALSDKFTKLLYDPDYEIIFHDDCRWTVVYLPFRSSHKYIFFADSIQFKLL